MRVLRPPEGIGNYGANSGPNSGPTPLGYPNFSRFLARKRAFFYKRSFRARSARYFWINFRRASPNIGSSTASRTHATMAGVVAPLDYPQIIDLTHKMDHLDMLNDLRSGRAAWRCDPGSLGKFWPIARNLWWGSRPNQRQLSLPSSAEMCLLPCCFRSIRLIRSNQS